MPSASDPHRDLAARADTFARLHRDGPSFVLANAWDAGSARLLASLGFPALGTTSAGLAASLGRPDAAARLHRDEVLDNARAIAAATDLPVSGDLEDGYGDSPDDVADTIGRAAAAGLVGGSVEDATGDAAAPIRPLDEAVERVAAAVDRARSLATPFVVTARAENHLNGRDDLGDTVARLRAYARAGADVVYAPALPDAEAVRTVVAEVGVPVNVLVGTARPGLDVATLTGLGVARISLGSAFARAALGAVERAAREVAAHGTVGFLADAMPMATMNALFGSEDAP